MACSQSDDDLRGIDPATELAVSEEKRERGLKYVSKSRITTYLQCPFKFFAKYWCEHRPPGTIYTERGTQVHETFEVFHENLKAHLADTGTIPERLATLMPDDYTLWGQWLDPYIGNFFRFEDRRWEAAASYAADNVDPRGYSRGTFSHAVLDHWEPVGVEVEFWLGDPPDDYDRADPDYVGPSPPVGDIPWMGKADLIAPTQSIPEVEGSGVVILDYKTGGAPTVKYEGAPFLDDVLNEGVFLETEYYGWLADECPGFGHEVDAVAAYYPKDDELIVGPYPDRERRFDIKRAALGMQKPPNFQESAEAHPDGPPVPANFDYEEQNLCHWGDGQCWFYPQCPSTAGE